LFQNPRQISLSQSFDKIQDMKRIVLFSTFLVGKNQNKLLELIFPSKMQNKVLAYMPSDGANVNKKYLNQWKQFAKNHHTKFNLINNSKTKNNKEIKKVYASNILVITGGNTFTLLRNLRRSGLDTAIKNFTQKNNFVLAGFSAGAIVFGPTIRVATIKGYDKNEVGIKNLAGLNILNFEVFTHYSKEWGKAVEKYEKTTDNQVKKIKDEDYIVLES